jgi:hypothetical protein
MLFVVYEAKLSVFLYYFQINAQFIFVLNAQRTTLSHTVEHWSFNNETFLFRLKHLMFNASSGVFVASLGEIYLVPYLGCIISLYVPAYLKKKGKIIPVLI